MTLFEWYQKIPADKRIRMRKELAIRCGVADVTMRSYINGNRNPTGRIFSTIQEFTEEHEWGVVTCLDLSQEVQERLINAQQLAG